MFKKDVMDIKRNGSQPLHGRVLASDVQVLGGLHAFWNDAVSIFRAPSQDAARGFETFDSFLA